MFARFFSIFVAATIMATFLLFSGCEKEFNSLEPAPYPTDAEVYIDEFGPGIEYQAFGDSKVDALEIDYLEPFSGVSAMKFVVPSIGDPAGFFAGGAFVNNPGRNLSGYNAITFRCKASMVVTLGLAGLGNDNTGNSKYVAAMTDLPVTTSWQKYTVPIPLPEKLQTERGMFQLAAGAQNGGGYDIWFDEVKFETLGTIAHPRPSMMTKTNNLKFGDSTTVEDTKVIFNVSGVDQTVVCSPGYFTFLSSDDAVATVDENGVIKAVGLGTANITAKLGEVDATGTVAVNVSEAPPMPTEPAPNPTQPPGNVISLFSNAYSNVFVDTWLTEWSDASLEDVQISGDDAKLYTNLAFAGIEFTSQTINATSMTHFHVDIWTPDPTADPAAFRIKLVNDVLGSISEHELTFTAASSPPLATGSWISFDIPFSDFVGLTSRDKLGQLIISGDPNTVYLDNIYFYMGGTATEPTQPAPTPTFPAGDVISLFSNPYTNVTIDTWSAEWDQADVADVQVAGDDVKLYTNLVFAGIEFLTQEIDATAMTHFHMNVWTPDPTADPAAFRIKLVNDVFGSISEHELTFTDSSSPPLVTGNWITFDIPLSDFAGLAGREKMGQLIISGDPNTVYVDNILFHK